MPLPVEDKISLAFEKSTATLLFTIRQIHSDNSKVAYFDTPIWPPENRDRFSPFSEIEVHEP